MRKTPVPQMTLAYLVGILQRSGRTIKVIDCIAEDIRPDILLKMLRDFEPEIALINTTTPSINSDMKFVEHFKKHCPDCFIAVFGTHVTALHEEIMIQNLSLDCVIRNEPEWIAEELAAALQEGKIIEKEIAGCTIRLNNKVIVGAERAFNPDLDGLGFPAWEYFDIARYSHPIFNKPYVMVNTSRGCVNNCIFCVASLFYGKKVRYRSVVSIIDEIENHVIGKFGIRHVWMYADDFTHSPDFVKEMCRAIIDRKIKITWWTNTRVNKPDEEMFRLMREAGCFMLSIGGESGNAQILKNIKKGTKPEHIKNTVDLLRRVGINSLVYFLIGLPGETSETIRETIEFAKKINPDYVEFYPATPYPGTMFYEIARTENLIVDENWDNYMCGGNEFVLEIPGVGKHELDEIMRKAYRDFYLRPSYAEIFLKRIMRPIEFVRLMNFGVTYFKRFILKDP
jgi:radical SAM superfamily enzyme YgiQ (UPF0313 family)